MTISLNGTLFQNEGGGDKNRDGQTCTRITQLLDSTGQETSLMREKNEEKKKWIDLNIYGVTLKQISFAFVISASSKLSF